MIIKVERCWGGKFMMETPDGKREFIRAETWTRRESRQALDLYENVYHFQRSKIRLQIR